MDSESNDALQWHQVVEKRIESKTRRFGKVSFISKILMNLWLKLSLAQYIESS